MKSVLSEVVKQDFCECVLSFAFIKFFLLKLLCICMYRLLFTRVNIDQSQRIANFVSNSLFFLGHLILISPPYHSEIGEGAVKETRLWHSATFTICYVEENCLPWNNKKMMHMNLSKDTFSNIKTYSYYLIKKNIEIATYQILFRIKDKTDLNHC